MNKKGMAIAQVFTFMVMVITFGFIMLFGYKAIAGFLEKGQQVEFVQFKNDLEAAVQRISTDYGSVRVENFFLPPSYEKICFIDVDYLLHLQERNDGLGADDLVGAWVKATGEMRVLCEENVVACSIWEGALAAAAASENENPGSGYESTDENVFLLPPAPVKIKLASLSIADSQNEAGNFLSRGYLCFPIYRGAFSLQLTGLGDHAEIAEYVPET